ncbi:hypothetical protein Agub_g841, partial [Astrephomene gubernaculifera]
MLQQYQHVLHSGQHLQSRQRLVSCGAKANRQQGGKASGRGFGSSAPASKTLQRRRGLEVQLLDDLPPVIVDPDSGIHESTRDTCLFFMNKTEELCGRLPKLLDSAWAKAVAERIDDCVSRPIALTSPGHTAMLHLLDITHDDLVNPALIAAVWDRVQPDAVTVDVPQSYIKSFTRVAKAMDPKLLHKLMAAPLTSLSGALDHADDFDRLRWHHAVLSVTGPAGSSPIAVGEEALVNTFAARDLYLSECVAVAQLAVAGAAAGGGAAAAAGTAVMVHGIDPEDDPAQALLDSDDLWGEADMREWQQRLLGAADPQLRAAVNTWLQGIPAGTSSSTPRQRFVLGRLLQALSAARQRALMAADDAWRSSHSNPQIRQQHEFRTARVVQQLGAIRDVACGR